jgi:hypothetical protein
LTPCRKNRNLKSLFFWIIISTFPTQKMPKQVFGISKNSNLTT